MPASDIVLTVILSALFIVTLGIFWANELTTVLRERRSRLEGTFQVDNTDRVVRLREKIVRTERKIRLLKRRQRTHRLFNGNSTPKLHYELDLEKRKLRKLNDRLARRTQATTAADDLLNHDVRFWINVRDHGHDVLGDHPLLIEVARQMTEYLADRRST